MRLITLKHRSEFLRIRGGVRAESSAFLIEAKARPAESAPVENGTGPADSVRFGFTVTKKLGGAVDRNRIRRRLKEALRALDVPGRLAKFDCVIVARKSALDRPFAVLKDDLTKALAKIERDVSRGDQSREGRGSRRTGTG